jgi:hypothetical protein
MLKMDTLRAAITEAVPELAAHPARLKMWIDRGSAQSRQTETFHFTYAFRLNVFVEELATDISVLSLAIFRWLRVNQPDLLAPGTDGFTFDVDVLDNNTVDVLFLLALTQNVTVAQQPDGKFALQYLPEPDPLWDDPLGLGGTAPIPPLAAIVLNGDTIIEPGT